MLTPIRHVCNQNKQIFSFVKRMLDKSAQEYVNTYNRRFNTQETTFNLGGVYIKRRTPKQHKLQSKFLGPYRIVNKSADSVTVRNLYNSKESTVHLSYVNLLQESELINTDSPSVMNMGVYPESPYDIDENQ